MLIDPTKQFKALGKISKKNDIDKTIELKEALISDLKSNIYDN